MKKIIVANWKMYLSADESKDCSQRIADSLVKSPKNLEVALCPSFIPMKDVALAVRGSPVMLGAQDVFWEEKGAYTGEVSVMDLKSLGCSFVIAGHSERRKFFQESNKVIHEKVRMCLLHGLIPIICVGEDWEQRRNGQKDYVLIQQLNEILEGIVIQKQRVIVAYEPVWAISGGGGVHADPKEVEYAHEVIRHVLMDMYGSIEVNSFFQIIYGGSVSAENIHLYTNLPQISGVLVGSASTKPETFLELIGKI